MICQTSCGHVQNWPHGWPPMRLRCKECETQMGADPVTGRVYSELIAIECREWKTSCGTRCHWARWYGQDKASAELAAGKHKHFCTVDYLRHPASMKQFRQQYPRKIRAIVAINKQALSGMRRYSGEKSPQLQVVEKLINPDVPPF
jgi:hypothetical protein